MQVAFGLADRFEATLIGIAGLSLQPAFAAGGLEVYTEPLKTDRQQITDRLEEMGRKFIARGQCLKQVEWRTALETSYELIAREARASDLVILGHGHAGLADPGMVLLRAGRPVLVVPDVVSPLDLRRVIVAWKDTRECRRAVRDALPFLRQAKEVLTVEFGEEEAKSEAKGLWLMSQTILFVIA